MNISNWFMVHGYRLSISTGNCTFELKKLYVELCEVIFQTKIALILTFIFSFQNLWDVWGTVLFTSKGKHFWQTSHFQQNVFWNAWKSQPMKWYIRLLRAFYFKLVMRRHEVKTPDHILLFSDVLSMSASANQNNWSLHGWGNYNMAYLLFVCPCENIFSLIT